MRHLRGTGGAEWLSTRSILTGYRSTSSRRSIITPTKVNAVFADIQAQAQTLLEENEQMRAQLARLNGQKAEIGEAVLSAQQIYREIVDKANVRAAEIVAGAEKRREEIQAENLRQQEYAVKRGKLLFPRCVSSTSRPSRP